MTKRFRFSLVFIVAALTLSLASAQANSPQEWIEAKNAKAVGIPFISTSGALDASELAQFKRTVIQRRLEVRMNLENNARKEDLSDEKIAKKIKKNKLLHAFDLELAMISELEKASDSATRVRLARNISELDTALKSDAQTITESQVIKHVKVYLKQISISKTKAPLGEAMNLVDPRTGRIFSRSELKEYVRRGGDVSKLDPPRENGVLDVATPLESNSPRARFSEGQNPVHGGLSIVYPKDNVVQFEEIRKKQTKPKLTVSFVDDRGEKREYKLKLGTEIHSEPTAAALASALGVYSDISRYVRDIKVMLGKLTYEQFKLEWNSYYATYELDKLVKARGSDQNGNYVVFTDGLYEPELDESELKRMGPWYWGSVDHKMRREFRGLLLFNVWIHNTDVKEGENNKLLLKARPDGQHDFFYLQQDQGFSLGHYFGEKPQDFMWQIVELVNNDRVEFNYRTFQPTAGFTHVTWADARWMVRRIARLSRKQIEEAVEMGGWPHRAPFNYRQLMAEKLISRRNDMVKAFGLEGDLAPDGTRIQLMSVDRHVEKQAFASKKNGLPDYTVDFSPEMKNSIMDPAMKRVGELIRDGAITLAGTVNRISVEPEWFGWDDGVITQVIVNTSRTVVKNPNPKNLEESYIVRDDFKLGARLGYGMVVSGDVSYVRSFSLVYPVATHEIGMTGDFYLARLLVNGYSNSQASLPRGHIMLAESYLEGRGRLKFDQNPVTIGVEGTASRVHLSRSVVSRKSEGKILFFEDSSVYTQLAGRLFTKLVVLKIHHLSMSMQTGSVERDVYEVNANDDSFADAAIFSNDFAEIKKRGVRQKLTSKFMTESTKISLFGFWQRDKELRRDVIDIWSMDMKGKPARHQKKLLIEMSALSQWQTALNGEKHLKQIGFSSSIDAANGKAKAPVLRLTFIHSDKNATNDELVGGYLPFVDAVAGKRNFLSFSPRLHAVPDGWGEIEVRTNIEIYDKGVVELMRVNEEKFRRLVMAELGRPGGNYAELGHFDSGTNLRYYGKTYSVPEIREAVDAFLGYWREVASQKDVNGKAEALVTAIYKGVTGTEDAYQPIVLRVLERMIAADDMYMDAQITVPEGVENKFPGRLAPYNRIGEQQSYSKERRRLLFDLSEGLEIYQAF